MADITGVQPLKSLNVWVLSYEKSVNVYEVQLVNHQIKFEEQSDPLIRFAYLRMAVILFGCLFLGLRLEVDMGVGIEVLQAGLGVTPPLGIGASRSLSTMIDFWGNPS